MGDSTSGCIPTPSSVTAISTQLQPERAHRLRATMEIVPPAGIASGVLGQIEQAEVKLLRIGAETSEARVDVGVDDDVRTQRAVEEVADVDDLSVAGRRMIRPFLVGVRAAQQLAA